MSILGVKMQNIYCPFFRNEELFMEAEVNEKSPIRFRQASGVRFSLSAYVCS